MPAVPLALAEIEERLEEIRYLLNRRSLFSVAAPLIGVFLGVAGLVVWSASRADADSFSLALYAALGASLVLLVWATLVLWRRWLSVDDVARIADNRAGLQERLSTVLWLARAGIEPSMAPVVVADTIDRRGAWQASSIVARRLPWELAYVLAGALALTAALYLAGRTPPAPEAIAQPKKPPHPLEQQRPEPRRAGDDGEPLLSPDDSAEGLAGSEKGDGDAGEGAKIAGAMSEQLRGAIRQALKRFEQSDQPRDLSSGSSGGQQLARAHGDPAAADQGEQKPEARADGAKQGAATTKPQSAAGSEKDEPADDAPIPGRSGQRDGPKQPGGQDKGSADDQRDARRGDPGEANQTSPKGADQGSPKGSEQQPQAQSGSGSAAKDASEPSDSSKSDSRLSQGGKKPQAGAKGAGADGGGKGGQQGGGKAAGGPGDGPGGLFAAKGAPGTEVNSAPHPATFKMTLGSFLSSGSAGPDKPKSPERVPAQNARAAVTEPPSLNPNQTADDALRRADIPPEYEEIVRRIYSSRPAK